MRCSRLAIWATVLAVAFALIATRAAAGGRSPHDRVMAGLMCIHRFEGSWDDPGAPYFGGLQMDIGFMQAYGRPFLQALGTADRWPVAVQLTVGYAGYLARGWAPWPVSARLCGLK